MSEKAETIVRVMQAEKHVNKIISLIPSLNVYEFTMRLPT